MNKKLLKQIITSAGGYTGLATSLGIHRTAVHQWRQIPATRCIEIETLTDEKFTRYHMRPDVFGDPTDAYIHLVSIDLTWRPE